jgi:hypothetical protein
MTLARFSSTLDTVTYTRTLTLGSSIVTITGAQFACSTSGTYLTVTPSTATIKLSSASAKTFQGANKSWPAVQNTGAGALTISGNNTFSTLQNTVQPTTFTFTSGSTQTVTTFNINGTAGNLVTINASTAGTAATISKTSGTVNANYLTIQDSTATGGAIWYAGANSTNVSGNTGWIFANAPNNNGNFFFFM